MAPLRSRSGVLFAGTDRARDALGPHGETSHQLHSRPRHADLRAVCRPGRRAVGSHGRVRFRTLRLPGRAAAERGRVRTDPARSRYADGADGKLHARGREGRLGPRGRGAGPGQCRPGRTAARTANRAALRPDASLGRVRLGQPARPPRCSRHHHDFEGPDVRGRAAFAHHRPAGTVQPHGPDPAGAGAGPGRRTGVGVQPPDGGECSRALCGLRPQQVREEPAASAARAGVLDARLVGSDRAAADPVRGRAGRCADLSSDQPAAPPAG